MYSLQEVIDIALAPLQSLVDPKNRMAFIYLFSSLLVAVIFYLVETTRDKGSESRGLLRWLLPKDIIGHRSARADYVFFVLNKILLAAIYGSILLTAPAIHIQTTRFLEAVLGPAGDGFAPHFGLSLLCTLVIVLTLDFTLWALHLMFHKVPVLWNFHKVHHSAEVMTPVTAARMHPVEEVLDSLASGVAIGATYATLHYLLGPAAVVLTLFQIDVFLAIFYFSAFHLRHSHVWLRYPYWLQHIFVSPAQHQVHHSIERKHWDRNMGFIFAFWDWAFGTLYAPRGKEELTFGLGTREDGGMWHSVRALYLLPFHQSYEQLREKLVRRRQS